MKISDLKYNSGQVEILCYVLYVRESKNITRLFVTDFTKNPLLKTENSFESKFDDVTLSEDMVLQVTCFNEQFESLKSRFRIVTCQHLIDPDSGYKEQFIKEKFCFLRMKLRTKQYKGNLDAIVRDVVIVHQDALASDFYNEFFAQLPKSYIRDNWHALAARIPDQFMPPVALPDTIGGQLPDLSDEEDENNEESNGTIEPDHGFIKQEDIQFSLNATEEEFQGGIIPDTQYPNDYTDAQGATGDSEHTQVSSHIVSQSSNASSNSNALNSSPQLSRYSTASQSLSQDVHILEGYLVGTNPEDISRVCSKSYVYDYNNNLGLSDPKYRNLALIFHEPGKMKQVEVVIKDLNQFFGNQLIEIIYTQLDRYKAKLDDTIHSRKLTKVKIKQEAHPMGAGLPYIWTTEDLTIQDLLS